MDPTYSLRWPRALFEWEARRVTSLDDRVVADAVALLLREAFEDAAVTTAFGRETGHDDAAWASPGVPSNVRAWLSALLEDGSRMVPYRPPRYWAERRGAATAPELLGGGFAEDFVELLSDMQTSGYFPRALPEECVDAPVVYSDVNERIRRAVKLNVELPIGRDTARSLSTDALYSLVEYFHDEAQRPRVANYHSYGDCGWHYSEHNRESGGAVYRWRVNERLRARSVGLKLGMHGEERGRLIRHSDAPLDDLADSIVAERGADPEDEVTHAISQFRARDATVAQRRGAVAFLFGALEPRRKRVEEVLTKRDESDLFLIANRFTIRHRDKAQRGDYGDEFLDWMFWSALAVVRLVERIEAREKSE